MLKKAECVFLWFKLLRVFSPPLLVAASPSLPLPIPITIIELSSSLFIPPRPSPLLLLYFFSLCFFSYQPTSGRYPCSRSLALRYLTTPLVHSFVLPLVMSTFKTFHCLSSDSTFNVQRSFLLSPCATATCPGLCLCLFWVRTYVPGPRYRRRFPMSLLTVW